MSSLPSGLLPDMNVLLIDAQGMEFEILTGMAAALAPPSSSRGGNGTGFEAAVVEVSHVSVYEVSNAITSSFLLHIILFQIPSKYHSV